MASAGDMDVMPVCALCGTTLMFCVCQGHPMGQDVVFPFPKLPEDATPLQRMERYLQHATRNPAAAGGFDSQRWMADIQAGGVLSILPRLRPRLEAMMAHYCTDSTKDGYLKVHGTMQKHMPAGITYSKEQCREEVETAVKRFCTFDWSRMSNWDIAIVGNVYEASDPEEYPLTDSDLKFGYGLVSALRSVTGMASERLPYSFEPFDWQ